jgi:hypothetical protein
MKSIASAVTGLASSLFLNLGLTRIAEKLDTVRSLAAKSDLSAESCWLCHFSAEADLSAESCWLCHFTAETTR